MIFLLVVTLHWPQKVVICMVHNFAKS